MSKINLGNEILKPDDIFSSDEFFEEVDYHSDGLYMDALMDIEIWTEVVYDMLDNIKDFIGDIEDVTGWVFDIHPLITSPEKYDNLVFKTFPQEDVSSVEIESYDYNSFRESLNDLVESDTNFRVQPIYIPWEIFDKDELPSIGTVADFISSEINDYIDVRLYNTDVGYISGLAQFEDIAKRYNLCYDPKTYKVTSDRFGEYTN